MALFCAATSYITDVTTEQNRALRIYIMEGSFFIALGLVLAGVGMNLISHMSNEVKNNRNNITVKAWRLSLYCIQPRIRIPN